MTVDGQSVCGADRVLKEDLLSVPCLMPMQESMASDEESDEGGSGEEEEELRRARAEVRAARAAAARDGDDDRQPFGEIFERAASGATSATPKPDAADGKEAWLCYLNGKLYLRLKAGMGPLQYAVISSTTLQLETVASLPLPELEESNREQATVQSATSEPLDNFATFEQGARVTGTTEATVPGDGARERNLLLPAEQRTAPTEGDARCVGGAYAS